ncbi:MAG: methyltransferase domain-containing protein [Planctomycetota bacterium]|nr:methyltransferase domain-containing protein [Planctomycetota bacterium]MDP6762935.1 methyltransferase domain-containing protein [Planctomycetota bacterium]MDP6990888.1 methyltransferase domain-containing protein [Planctomycetota bacterium]
MQAPPPSRLPADVDGARLAPVLADLGLAPGDLARATGEHGGRDRGALLAALEGADPAGDGSLDALAALADEALAPDGLLLALLPREHNDRALARLRNGLWPRFHLVALYELTERTARRRTLQGSGELSATALSRGMLLVAHRREHVLSPAFTVAKFDQAAAGWNGTPGSPGYPHFRWMRRLVGRFGAAGADGRVLDFGCGAGWVGIEAALAHGSQALRLFDPSPEMVAIATANARAAGIDDVQGATGFGERPPFPAEGEAPFDLVLSSGVISFSPDPDAWLDGLSSTVAPGGVLVIGDLHRESRGFRRRRARRPLLPVRELNALTRDEVRAGLAERGFHHEACAAYQLTRPVPELMHLNEQRLAGALARPLLWANQAATAVDASLGSPGQAHFDSWVMRLRRGG